MPLERWPPQAGRERSARILAEVRRGNFLLEWCPIQIGELKVIVSCDALKIDGVRVNVDAVTQQLVADELQAVLLTPKLADEIWLRSLKLSPSPQPISSSTQAMIDHSARVDAKLAGRRGIAADVGKDWVIARNIFSPQARAANKAANYGWHVATGGEASQSTPSLRVIQDIGTAHDDRHTDYSQVARFVRRAALYGELPVDLAQVYVGKDPGNALVSHEGPLPDWRQPGADEGPGDPGFPSSEPPTMRSGAKRGGLAAPLVGGAGLGVLAFAAGAGPLGIAAAALVGGILGRRASA